MSENNDHDARKPRISTPNPAGDGQGGLYVAGDYGDAGAAHQGGIAAGQPKDFSEDQNAVPGRHDGDTDRGARRA
jgi:hypothetical protein